MVAQRLLELRNFNSLLAVVGGLGHGSIARLRQTLGLLPPPLTQLWGRLAEAVGSGGNYRRYRALLGGGGPGGGGAGGGGGFALPALGVHLRDLVALEEALPDWGGPGRPHPHKLRQRFQILGGLLGGREHGPPVPADPELLRLLEVSLELGQTEEQLYQLSLRREPRGTPSPGPPLTLPPPCPMEELALPEPPPPDPVLLRARLERLVETIFRDFDVDGDGRISREEFGAVREAFPQLQLLGGHGASSLTRGEVLAQFLRCSQCQDPPPGPPGPPHSFESSRPLRPAACRHCGRLILGLNKQALKCRSCGLRVHAACRERLRVECRRRSQSVAADPPPRPPPGPPPRSYSFSQPPPETPPELEELQDGVFDIRL